MDGGKIQMEGTPKEVFVNIESIKKFGLDVPQVTELAHNLIDAGILMSRDIIKIEELVDAICQ
jgi:energy-coupling factor transport system ATP-binding protein